MVEFIDVALGFPTALFSFSLLVVAGYWGLVAMGGLGLDALDADADTGAGIGGSLAAVGLGGVPVTVAFSLLVAVSWFVSLAGAAVGVPGALVLVAALAVGWTSTALLVRPLRRIFRYGAPAASRRDFVGRECVIRTGRVGADFGQAEVTADDGTSALVQVRVPSSDLPVAGKAAGLVLGSSALIFDYDQAGEFFWVMPYDG
ncbi:hypothetical protein [Actinomadura sp. 9N407]|uniref:hypothetical protein n=1 Tax=Actinomadura sp. 9N407 TaxID=3375154 RepID=UPI0037AA189E